MAESWESVQNAIKAAVQSAVGVQKVYWENEPEAVGWAQSTPGQPLVSVELSLRTIRELGTDEPVEEYDEDEDRNNTTTYGLRDFVVTCRLKSDSQVPKNAAVGTLAGRLRMGLKRERIVDALLEAGVAIVRLEPTATGDYRHESRLISQAVIDVVFSCSETDTDPEDNGDYIGRVRVRSEYLQHGDEQAPHQVDVTIEGSE